MVIDFECNNCNGDFELDVADMIESPKPIKCPHCKAKVDAKASEDFATVLEDLIAQVSAMSKKFTLTMTLETDDLPGAYAKEEEDEDEDEDDEDIDLDDEELGEDEADEDR
jgi:DNA-directed RNA polymerase subunit RPC12/RpoP